MTLIKIVDTMNVVAGFGVITSEVAKLEGHFGSKHYTLSLTALQRLQLLEKFYNYDSILKGSTFFALCKRHRFLTHWIPNSKDGRTVRFSPEWFDQLLLMKAGYQDTFNQP
ncbi:MAG: hypothetical protein JSR33_01810 [Proteobacteria bacterium]|nr:hypothetical protein [Pseudomonadota bacterium]